MKRNFNQKNERQFVTEIFIYSQDLLKINLKMIVITMDDDIIRTSLHTLIMALLLIEKNATLNLICERNVKKIIKEFINLQSERRRLDNRYYTELTFIEYWLRNIKVKIRLDQNDEILIKDDTEIKQLKESLAKVNLSVLQDYTFKLINYNVAIKEFNLYWNSLLIFSAFRD